MPRAAVLPSPQIPPAAVRSGGKNLRPFGGSKQYIRKSPNFQISSRSHVRAVGIETSGLGRPRVENIAVSRTKQIDSQSVGGAPYGGRWRGSAVNWVLPPQIRTLRHALGSRADDDRSVISFRRDAAASRQTLGLRRPETNSGSNVIRLRTHHHGPQSWDATAKSHEDNTRRYRNQNIGKHEGPTQADDDYDHRLFVTLLAAAVTILLIITGDWMVSTLVRMP